MLNVMGVCAGIGGLELGLHISEPRANPVLFVEQDEFCQSVLRARWPGVLVWSNILTFNSKPWRRLIDIFAAGFPCQPFSVAGKRLGTADERWIWPEIAQRIRDLAPPVVFLENVPALITGGGLAIVLGSLAEMGYVAVWGVFDCESLGASHLRKRVYILAYRDGSQLEGQERRRLSGFGAVGGELADSLCEQLWGQPFPGTECPVPAEPPQYQTPLGHAHSLRGRGDRIPQPGHPQAKGPGVTIRPLSPVLADGDGDRLSVGQEQYHKQFPATFGGCREIWAPGPGAEWRDVHRDFWPAEQSVRGMVDGVPSLVELLRNSRLRGSG